MSRAARIIPQQGYLHVMSRGNNRQRIFSYAPDYKVYCRILLKVKVEEQVKIHHYCLMPNHVHLLVGINDQSNLSRFMQRLHLKYFQYFRERKNFVGHFLQGRFKSKIINDERYFLQCGKYIELNPVRARLVIVPQEHPFSSYRYYALGEVNRIVDVDFSYIDLHSDSRERLAAYRNMMVDNPACEEELRICIHKANSINELNRPETSPNKEIK